MEAPSARTKSGGPPDRSVTGDFKQCAFVIPCTDSAVEMTAVVTHAIHSHGNVGIRIVTVGGIRNRRVCAMF